MQKYRFLLPLFILTLIVATVSYGVHEYGLSKTAQSSASTAENISGDTSNTSENIQEEGSSQSGGFLAKLFGSKKGPSGQSSQSAATATPKPMPSPVNTTFSQTEVSLPVNEQRDVFVTLDTGTNAPTAYTFNMSFDPKSISVVKIEPGDIWQQATIFTKANKIDNEKGTLTFSAGQSLGTQKGNGKTLVKVSIKASSTKTVGTELTIDATSKFAYVGLDYAIPLKSQSIQIQVTK